MEFVRKVLNTGVLRFDTHCQQTINRKTTFEMNRCDVKRAVVITCSNFILNLLQFAFRTMQGRQCGARDTGTTIYRRRTTYYFL